MLCLSFRRPWNVSSWKSEDLGRSIRHGEALPAVERSAIRSMRCTTTHGSKTELS